jgi:two-component sensor histidine kinase
MAIRFVKNLSIKHKLIAIVMFATASALLLSCVAFVVYDRIMYRKSMAIHLSVLADIISANSMAALTFKNAADANETLSVLSAERQIVAAQIFSDEGAVFATYARDGQRDHLIDPPLVQDGYRFTDAHLFLSRAIRFDGKHIGTVCLKADLWEMHLRLKRYAGIGILVMCVSSLGAFIVSARLQGIISNPVAQLAQLARTVSVSKDYSLRAQKQSRDELGFLTEQFNEMLEHIQDRDAALQRAHSQIEQRARQLQRELLERRRANARINASLREKEVLLKEIHHRVKNNLQIISSLLELQSVTVRDDKTLDVFKECRNRVRSMALVHERLYQAKDLASIKSAEYVDSLLASLRASYMANSNQVTLHARVKKAFLNIDTAIPCGLIINELVSNALKYAFPDGRSGRIEVQLRSVANDDLMLLVRDNGVGLPSSIDVWNTETLGLQVVTLLTSQHNGTIDLDRNGGTTFRITFPATRGGFIHEETGPGRRG